MKGEKTMNKKLKPCPFCGGEVHCFDCGVKGDFEDWAIECFNCHIAMIYYDDGCVSTKEEATEVWNRRYEDGNTC